ncbi:hypothetical protein HYPSUDRAFT_48703 [Hypholoma sublateritium FD-334 SS-4]|uniref:C2H2-type domain-containing protein n=1 Tax=Hypholoma sublateritium (strain FD-334 SS-4) TaxID=945553 RepID=A0A0D2P361_HYPSF|nr:hypothetical protein HYPSUDRAFT_48703 [Hypholoma sublateritium FD-334 SS-4]
MAKYVQKGSKSATGKARKFSKPKAYSLRSAIHTRKMISEKTPRGCARTTCPKCSKSYSRLGSLEKHIATHEIAAVAEDPSEPISLRDIPAPPKETFAEAKHVLYIEAVSDSELQGFGLPDPICLTGRQNAMDKYMATVPMDLLIQFMSLSDDGPMSQAADPTTEGSDVDMASDAKYEEWIAEAYYECILPHNPWGSERMEICIGRLLPLIAGEI